MARENAATGTRVILPDRSPSSGALPVTRAAHEDIEVTQGFVDISIRIARRA
jgi:hypothetical protein